MKSNYLIVGILMAVSISVYLLIMNRSDLAKSRMPVETTSTSYDAETLRDQGWAIIPREKEGEREIWFVAPEENGVSPALFKKTIHDSDEAKDFTIVSECEAPKPTCERLMQQFEALSKDYN